MALLGVGSSNITNGLLSSITGEANKAYMLFRNPDYLPQGTDNKPDVTAGLDTMIDNLQKKAKTTTAKSGSMGFSSVAGHDNSLVGIANEASYIPIKVQFNPSSINMSGRSGEIRSESTGGDKESQFQNYSVPTETILSMELIFDDVNSFDAFMVNEDLGSASAIGELGGQLINAAVGKEYSVQNISEIFVAAMLNAYTRMVGFVWNKIIFWGELTSVSVQYTMFNKKGNPIRSKVSIQIRQDRKAGDTAYETEKNWESAFENLFKVKSTNTAYNINNYASNIFNLN